MDQQAFVLGHILRRFKEFGFSMDTFNDRLRLQKFVYLLQAHGIYLGYDFSWYLRGPYCTSLTAAGLMLEGFYEMLPESGADKSEGFANGVIRSRFNEFRRLVRGRETDVNFLEAAASMHFLLKTGKANGHKEAADTVFEKMRKGYEYNETPERDRVDREYVEDVLRELVRRGLVGEDGGRPQYAEQQVRPIRLDLPGTCKSEQVKLSSLPSHLDRQYIDKTMYYTFHDAANVGEKDVEMVVRSVFRPDEERPVADDYIMNDGVVFDIRRKRGIGVPPGAGV